MQINIHHTQGLHMQVEEKSQVEEKVSSLVHLADRIADESSEIRVDLFHHQSKKQEESYECHLTLFVPHKKMRGEAFAGSLMASVDDAMSKVKSQIEKYKHKENHMEKRHNQ